MKKLAFNGSMLNIFDKTRYLVLVLIFAITFYLGYTWDVASLQNDLVTSVQKEATLKTQLQSVVGKEASIEVGLTQLPALKVQFDSWQKQISTYEQLPESLNIILNLAANNHLYVKLFSPDKEAKEKTYYKLPIKVSVYGTYHAIANFISQVVNGKTIVVVEDLVISSQIKLDAGEKAPKSDNASPLLSGNMTLAVYHLPQPGMPEEKTPETKPGAKPAGATTPAATPPTDAPAATTGATTGPATATNTATNEVKANAH